MGHSPLWEGWFLTGDERWGEDYTYRTCHTQGLTYRWHERQEEDSRACHTPRAHLACILTSEAPGTSRFNHINPVGLDSLRGPAWLLLHPDLLHQCHRPFLIIAFVLLRFASTTTFIVNFLSLHGNVVWWMRLCGRNQFRCGVVTELTGVKTKLFGRVCAVL